MQDMRDFSLMAGREPELKIDGRRMQEAQERAGLASDRALARKIHVGQTRPGAWRRGEGVPRSDHFWLMCKALAVSPGYLFGEGDRPARERLAHELRGEVGSEEAFIVALMGQMTDHQRAQLVGQAKLLASEGAPASTQDPAPRSRQEGKKPRPKRADLDPNSPYWTDNYYGIMPPRKPSDATDGDESKSDETPTTRGRTR